MRRLDVINVAVAERSPRPAPALPEACASNGCGGSETPAAPTEVGGEVRVGGVALDPDVIAREMQHHPAPTVEYAWLSAARALAVKALLCREAGVGDDDEQAIHDLLEREVRAHAPKDGECRRVYDAAPKRFASPELVEAAHILIEPADDTPGAWQRARLAAQKLIREIGSDASAFARAARAHSGCPSAQQDGSLGQVRRGELAPPVERALFALGEGEISQAPVQSTHGWHILWVHRRIPGKPLPYDIAAPRIRDMLEARSWAMAAAHYVGRLAAKHGVEGIDLAGSTP